MTRREWLAAALAAPVAAQSGDIDRFFESLLRDWVREEPETATALRIFAGAEQDRLDGRLNDISPRAQYARISRARTGLTELHRFDTARFSPEQRLSANMLEWMLTDVVNEEPFLDYRFPLNQFSGVQVRLPSLLTDLHPLGNRRDAQNFLARLGACSGKLDQATAAMIASAARGITPPAFILHETAQQMERFIAPEPARNILVASFAGKLQKVSALEPAERVKMSADALGMVRDKIYPAYRRAIETLGKMAATSGDDGGLWRLPRGADAYAFYLHRYTTTSLPPDEVHRLGLAEVARIEAEMDGMLKKLGYTAGPVAERMRKLDDDHLYPDTPDVRDRVLADYRQIIRDADERSAAAFNHRPKAACVVERIPQFQEANAAANYQAPPRDGSRPGIFHVPLRGPRFSRVSMQTLAHHEAIPGHHFQIALQGEMTSLPQFRRTNPFGSMSAFTEGWGLYAERLSAELGWYKNDPVSDLGRLQAELFRARRLVVDTGLHALRWTRRQAIDYGIEQSEVDRYVVMPGQACSYKVGQLKILELREKAKRELGAGFSLKEYHDVVLGNGAIPLALLETVVSEWIKQKSVRS